ncbi:MAG: DNA polymerase/3'-5' exonuclease PolX [Planctomycetota bacterium]
MDNANVARVLSELADLCEIRGENVFKIRALRSAADTIASLPIDVRSFRGEPEKLRRLKGIGEGIAKKIVEILDTGTCAEREELLAEYPASLLDLLALEGVGPKKIRLFFDALGVRSIDDLEAAATAGRIRGLPRMSAAAEAKILKAIAAHRSRAGRFLLSWAEPVVEAVVQALRELPGVRRVEAAGSYRRGRDTVGDLDFLVSSSDPRPVVERFAGLGEAIARGETKSSIRLPSGLQADLRLVPEESFGSALQYFTGSKAHNVAIRTMAVRKHLTVNEYGVFELRDDGSSGKRAAGESEEGVYSALGLPWIPPELREDRGEIEAALEGRLPRLIELREIRGDLHVHTTATDGSASVEEMALAAIERGYEYVAIADHSQSLTIAGGLDERRLRAQGAEIDRVNRRLGGRIRVLKGIEVDILRDGSLDLAPDALRELDVVVASVHSAFALPRPEMTARVVRAIESGLVDILGHPTGRMLLKREPYEIDLEAVFAAAKAHGVALELNAFPDRLDLSDIHCRLARDAGVRVVVSTDAHDPSHLDLLRFGVATARRGWLGPKDVANARPLEEFLRLVRSGHR